MKTGIPSPARSQGAPTTPRRITRRTRSVGSPGRASTLVQQIKEKNMDDSANSPLNKLSILNDNTDIELPQRQSWWKKLDDNSRDVMEVLHADNVAEVPHADNVAEVLHADNVAEVLHADNVAEVLHADNVAEVADVLEEYIDWDVLSQEKKTLLLDLPESSGSETIGSIVVPQRKLFTHKENIPDTKFGKLVGNRESLAKLQKTTNDDKTVYIGPKKLFEEAKRVKPTFPAGLLKVSSNKTVPDDLPANFRPKKLFGQATQKKRSPIQIDLLSESGAQKKADEPTTSGVKDLFGQGRERTKPAFPSGLLDISANKTGPNQTKELTQAEAKRGVQSLFGNRPSAKRKNMFADFVFAESEDEIPEIQAKVFELKGNAQRRESIGSRGAREASPTSSIATDIEMDDWKMLPSSTMMVEQLEVMLAATPKKKIRLSQLATHKEVEEEHQQDQQDCEQQNDQDNIEKIEDIQDLQKSVSNNEKASPDEAAFTNKSIANNETKTVQHVAAPTNKSITASNLSKIAQISSDIPEKLVEIIPESELEQEEIAQQNDEANENFEELRYASDNEDDNETEKSVLQSDQEDEDHEIAENSIVNDAANDEEELEEVNKSSDVEEEEAVESEEEAVESEEEAVEREEEAVESEEEAVESEEEAVESEEEAVESEEENVEEDQESDQTAEIQVESQVQSDEEQDSEKEEEEEVSIEQDVEENEKSHDASVEDEPDDNDDQDEDNQAEISQEAHQPEDETPTEESPNISHDTTGRYRKKMNETKIKTPEAVSQNISNQNKTFETRGRKTSVRKTKSVIKPIEIRPSLARDSVGSGSDFSAQGSGWDSHRTTRKTIRQTFGKDFTPRKSLRALVMEKSAKRQTYNVDPLPSESINIPQANSTEIGAEVTAAAPLEDVDMTAESDHDISRTTRQNALETYLQKVKKDTLERKQKMENAIRESLKAPQTTNVLDNFKIPAKPISSRRIPSKTKAKPKAKASTFLIGSLPEELIEELKYKPPKRFRKRNASWITKWLYQFLETKLEPKYAYKARVRAEKIVEDLYNFTMYIRRYDVAPSEAVDELKQEMARYHIVKTHFDFYEFFREFMPLEVKIKVVPDLCNKLPLPKYGVFADILPEAV